MAQSPIRPTDEDARALARSLMREARVAALAVITVDRTPSVSRIGFGLCPGGAPITLISDLSAHTRALRVTPACSIMVGEISPRGDPLNQPRLTMQAKAQFVTREAPEYGEMAAQYLRDHPKAKLYIDFADFGLVRFEVSAGFLNGGFGKAFELTRADLGLPV